MSGEKKCYDVRTYHPTWCPSNWEIFPPPPHPSPALSDVDGADCRLNPGKAIALVDPEWKSKDIEQAAAYVQDISLDHIPNNVGGSEATATREVQKSQKSRAVVRERSSRGKLEKV